MREFDLSVLSADMPEYTGKCTSLIIPAVDGLFGIMAGHTDLICAVVPGLLSYTTPDGIRHRLSVSAGILKVEDGAALVLVDSAERPEDIDRARAERSKRAAEEELRRHGSDRDYQRAVAALARAASRLRIAGKQGQPL